MEWNHERDTHGLLAQWNGLHRQLTGNATHSRYNRNVAERVSRPAPHISRYSKEGFMATEKISNLTSRSSSQIAKYGLFTGIIQQKALKH
jgi:hypothetical protein